MPLHQCSLRHPTVFLPVLIDLHGRILEIDQDFALSDSVIFQRGLVYGLLEV